MCFISFFYFILITIVLNVSPTNKCLFYQHENILRRYEVKASVDPDDVVVKPDTRLRYHRLWWQPICFGSLVELH